MTEHNKAIGGVSDVELIAQLTTPIEQRVDPNDPNVHWTNPVNEAIDDMQMAMALAADRIAALSQSGGVRVKPLLWGSHSRVIATVNSDNSERSLSEIKRDWHDNKNWSITAQAEGFRWSIVKWSDKLTYELSDHGPLSEYETLDEAKAAAQADYERRILSALEHTTQPTSEAAGEKKSRYLGTIAHVDHGKTSLTAAVTKLLSTQPAHPVGDGVEIIRYGYHVSGVMEPLEDGDWVRLTDHQQTVDGLRAERDIALSQRNMKLTELSALEAAKARLREAIEAHLPYAQVAFLWSNGDVKEGEVDAFRKTYHALIAALSRNGGK